MRTFGLTAVVVSTLSSAFAAGCAGKPEAPQRFATNAYDDPPAYVAATCGIPGATSPATYSTRSIW